ncbi:MAG: amidohydrolase [Actinomycetota bacterium]
MSTLISADRIATGSEVVGNAILVVDGKIASTGDRDELRPKADREIHYAGATIIPGLRDAHMHPVPYAALLDGCSLKQAADIEDLQRRLRDFASTLDANQPVVATRLDDESLSEQRLPTKHDLDIALPGRSVVIYRYCGHVAVASTAALAASGITADTPDPEGGTIDRDVHGTPTGILRETAAGLVASALARGGELSEEALLSGLTALAGVGITSIGAIIGYGERPFEQLQAELELWQRVRDRLPIKVHGFVITDTPEQVEHAEAILNAPGSRLRWLGIKRFADGSLGGHTAAMHTPFADVDTRGTLRLSAVDTAVSRKSIELGGMVAIHAIGDRAVDGVLDIFDLLVDGGANPADLRMEHVSVISPDQVARFAALGVTAAVQPAFLASEHEWVAGRVGPDRTSWLYPLRSLLEHGVPLAGSSDCPVEPPQPLWGMAAAMDRYGVASHERLTGADALALFTSGAAAALREPVPLSIGSPADITVIDTDPTSATPAEVRETRVLDTYVDGIAVSVDRTQPVWPD